MARCKISFVNVERKIKLHHIDLLIHEHKGTYKLIVRHAVER